MADLHKFSREWLASLVDNPAQLNAYINKCVQKRVDKALQQLENEYRLLHQMGPFELHMERGARRRWIGTLREPTTDVNVTLSQSHAIVLARLALHADRDRSKREVAPLLPGLRLRTDDLRVPDFDPDELLDDEIGWKGRQARKHLKALRELLDAHPTFQGLVETGPGGKGGTRVTRWTEVVFCDTPTEVDS